MNPRRVLCVCSLLIFAAPHLLAQKLNISVQTANAGGASVTIFATKLGDVRVTLPDDIAVGDTISGTVSIEPAGKGQKEKQRNGDELKGYVIEIDNQKSAVSGGIMQRIHLVPNINPPILILLDEKGKQIVSTPIALLPATTAPSNFNVPTLGQTGRPVQIIGPFDGDSSNTNVKIGGVDAPVLAESPRKLVVTSPGQVVGPSEIKVIENGNTASGAFRNLKIDLTAPKTSLLKGESTELRVQVEGLQGLSQPVQLQLQNQSPSTVNLSGGNTQTININPSSSSTNGQQAFTRTITGVTAGRFNITSTVLADVPPSTGPATATPTPTPSPGTNIPTEMTPLSLPSSRPVEIAAPSPQASPPPSPVGASAAELKKRCDDLQKQLSEAKGPCEAKKKECADLERALEQAKKDAQKAEDDWQKQKAELEKLLRTADLNRPFLSDARDGKAPEVYDQLMQDVLNFINGLANENASIKGWKFAATSGGKDWQQLRLSSGVVIWFLPDPKTSKDEVASFTSELQRKIISDANMFTKLNVMRLVTPAAIAELKRREAQAALTAARTALGKCQSEKDILCPKVEELARQLEKCRQEAAAQAEVERKTKEKEDADKKAAAEKAKRTADDAEKKKTTDAAKAQAEANRLAEEAKQKAKERADKQRVCTRCLRLFVEQAVAQAQLTAAQKSALEAFMNQLDKLNGDLQNVQTAADLIPQLSQLSDLLGKLNAAKDVIDRVNTAINQIKQLATGGNGPEQLGVAIQLAAGALDAAAQAIPILGPLASYFKVLADAVSASISAAYALRDMEGMKFGVGRIDEWSSNCQVVSMYDAANGDLDKVYDRLFPEADKTGIMRETPEMKARLKQILMAKIQECCLKMIKTQCPILK